MAEANVIFRLTTQVTDKDGPKELGAEILKADQQTKEAQATMDKFTQKLERNAVASRSAATEQAKVGTQVKATGNAAIDATKQVGTLGNTITKAGQSFRTFTRVDPSVKGLLTPLIDQTRTLGNEANKTATAFDRMKAKATPGPGPLGANPIIRPTIPGGVPLTQGTGPGVSRPALLRPTAAPGALPGVEPQLGLLARLRGEIDALNKKKLTLTNPAEIAAVNGQLAKTTDEFNKLDKAGARVGKSITGAGGAFGNAAKQFATFFGIDALVRSFIGIVSSGVSELFAFDDALAELSSITGAVGPDLEFLSDAAKEVGETTTISATEALKAFTAIGSARPDLLKNKEALAAVTKEAIALAEAAKINLADAGSAVASAMNQFNLPAEDAGRIVNALAAGSLEGAANVNELRETIDKVGTVMAANNIPFEKGVALVETLAEKEIKGAEAGTQLRGVILKLTQAGKGFQSGQFDINDALEQTKKEFDAIKDPVKKAETAVKLFGIENVTAGNILLNNIDKVEKFTAAVTGTQVAYDQQAKNNATVAASFAKLRNAVNGVFLSLSSSTGAFAKALTFVANNLKTFLKVIGVALVAVGAYKGAVLASSLVTRGLAAAKLLAARASAFFTTSVQAGTTSVKALSTAIKLNPLGLLASALAAVITYFTMFGEEADAAAEAQAELNKEMDETIKKRKQIADTISGTVEKPQEFSVKEIEDAIGGLREELAGLKDDTFEVGKALTDARFELPPLEVAPVPVDLPEDALFLDKGKFDRATERGKKNFDAVIGAYRRYLGGEIKRLEELIAKRDEAAAAPVVDGPKKAKAGTIEALQQEQAKLNKRLNEQLRIGSPEFAKTAQEYVKVTEALRVASDSIKGVEVFPAGSLSDLNQELSFLKDALQRLPEDAVGFDALVQEANKLQEQIDAINDKLKPKGNKEATAALLADLQEQERHALEVADLDAIAAKTRATNKGATEAQLTEIEAAAAEVRLNLQLDYELQRLAIMEAGGVATAAELEKQRNAIEELRLKLKLPTVTVKAGDDGMKKLVAKIADGAQEIAQLGIDAWKAWGDAQSASIDRQIELQQGRIDEAAAMADKGGARILEEEKKRMQELTNARQKAAQRNAAIAQAEAAANAVVAISRAAAEGGGFASAITIAATLIALTAGIAQARSLATSSVPSFYEGGSSKDGGFTGHGNPRQVSRQLGSKHYEYHKEEYIMPHEVVATGRNKQWFGYIHKHRKNVDDLIHPKVSVVSGRTGGISDKQTDRIVQAIRNQPTTSVHMGEDGITMLVNGRSKRNNAMRQRL